MNLSLTLILVLATPHSFLVDVEVLDSENNYIINRRVDNMFFEGQRHEVVGGCRGILSQKILKIWPLGMHFLHSGAQIRVFEQNTDIIKFRLFF